MKRLLAAHGAERLRCCWVLRPRTFIPSPLRGVRVEWREAELQNYILYRHRHCNQEFTAAATAYTAPSQTQVWEQSAMNGRWLQASSPRQLLAIDGYGWRTVMVFSFTPTSESIKFHNRGHMHSRNWNQWVTKQNDMDSRKWPLGAWQRDQNKWNENNQNAIYI